MKFVSSVSMAALAPAATATAAALAPLGAAAINDGVTVVHVSLSPTADRQLPRFPEQKQEEMDAARSQINADPDLMASLDNRDIRLEDVVAIDGAEEGGSIIYVADRPGAEV